MLLDVLVNTFQISALAGHRQPQKTGESRPYGRNRWCPKLLQTRSCTSLSKTEVQIARVLNEAYSEPDQKGESYQVEAEARK